MAFDINSLTQGFNNVASNPGESAANVVGSPTTGQITTITAIIILLLLIIVLFIVVIIQAMKYNKIIHIHKLVDNHFIEFAAKGGIFKDKNKIAYLKSTVFGLDKDQIKSLRVPSGEYWEPKMTRIWGMPFMPYTIRESINMVLIDGNYMPIKPNFVTLKRGEKLIVSDVDDCDFCKHGLDSYKFMVDQEDYIKNIIIPLETTKKIKINLDVVCKKCFSNIINAKYECVDVADKGWYYKTLEDNKNRYADFLTKFMGPMLIAAFLIFTIIFLFIVFNGTPAIIKAITNSRIEQYNAYVQGQQTIYNVTAPPAN